jgi:hypothetical protein
MSWLQIVDRTALVNHASSGCEELLKESSKIELPLYKTLDLATCLVIVSASGFKESYQVSELTCLLTI